ncbi:MAG: Glycosyl transferase, WecB/TagA/CpsF family [Candidatus Woesebacteria bacterium GW2011_GWB1_39_10]|uniref:Glycosyl transferase, WecB/TagA/CpsF family n=2 Tax=Candidatus Woeseibacteriota TaxID=1752722 RepID=A0A0G0X6Y5_9BACT|nr:MAG: Glycosyl transferase, WecB/TagA/CpsF family [Candidatus Woesebacteria bacterium GW2011_GWB1_39_10]KKR92425.1 MAG: Glycosyl transferase, WecB/TagA/CpsF family [Candidatus Woesebacteria bacterium GW2011_GWA1_41_13b]
MKIKPKKDQRVGQILGINVLSSSINSLLTGVEKNISCNTKFSIMTPNPELVLMAQKNKLLKKALNSADYPVPDGVGLAYASRFLFGKSLDIIPGRKLFEELIRLAVKKNWKVFLLGGLGDEAEIASQKLQSQYPKLQIQFDKFFKLDESANLAIEVDVKSYKDVIDKINKFVPNLLFVAFGNPKQEIWIHDNLSKLKIGGAMTVGGTFRYIAGLSPLPPVWMEKAGLEWFFRLLTEPRRALRILNAFPIFPIKIFWYKLTHL